MKTVFAILLAVFGALAQAGWAWLFNIGFVIPGILLVMLVIITIRGGLKLGLWSAFVSGLLLEFFVPNPVFSFLIAGILTVYLIGFLAESVLGTVSVFTIVWQIVIATIVYTLIYVSLFKLSFIWWGAPLDVSWGRELMAMAWQVLYNILLGLGLYFILDWLQTALESGQRNISLSKGKFF